MNMRAVTMPRTYHDAVLKWKDTFLPDWDFLMDHWEKHFPNDAKMELCAYRELGMCQEIEVGAEQGKPKFTRAAAMHPEQAHHLFSAIKAQASTEFGSIQQHRLTLARAQHEEEQFWVLRMMAEELRHGYQMLHLLVEDDWSSVAQDSSADLVDEILSMTTGSHVLGAFNIDFDSFVDNVVFCCLIDRVGKYQLAMQRVSAYQPMAESMPQMLREEAFHLATGVVPMRRWAQQAAEGEVYVTMEMLQKAIDKWLPRGLEMFGDERGGGTNVRFGLKPMKNAEAQDQYYEEVRKVVRDLNSRYLRARLPELDLPAANAALDRLEQGDTVHGVRPEELLYPPHKDYFRRRGVPAFRKVGSKGEELATLEEYLGDLRRTLPESYLAAIDFREFVEQLRRVEAGELTAEEASRQLPTLRRVAGSCPCSKSVRWVVEEPQTAVSGNGGEGHPAGV
jgi:1,2-phenylacetyl-CoA epoxidase catalytic subunit